jgi:hypothetical protein
MLSQEFSYKISSGISQKNNGTEKIDIKRSFFKPDQIKIVERKTQINGTEKRIGYGLRKIRQLLLTPKKQNITGARHKDTSKQGQAQGKGRPEKIREADDQGEKNPEEPLRMEFFFAAKIIEFQESGQDERLEHNKVEGLRPVLDNQEKKAQQHDGGGNSLAHAQGWRQPG